ncbi:unnamed protein product, partial [Ectocarpus sp. 12 AP-2014]
MIFFENNSQRTKGPPPTPSLSPCDPQYPPQLKSSLHACTQQARPDDSTLNSTYQCSKDSTLPRDSKRPERRATGPRSRPCGLTKQNNFPPQSCCRSAVRAPQAQR